MLDPTMTHSDYLAHRAYGATDLIRMSRSFAYWKYRRDNPEKKGRPLVIGSAFHLALQAKVTHRASLADGILVYDKGSWRTKGFEQFETANPGIYCLDLDEKKLVDKMLLAFLNNDEAMGYVTGALAEPSIITAYPETAVRVKCRPDYLHKGRAVSVNIKTTNDASESGFLYAARDFGYDWQSALYCNILSDEFGGPYDEVHILVEKTDDDEPVPINIYSFSDDTLAFARAQIWELLKKIPECEKSGVWPMPPTHLQTLDLPLHMRRAVSL